MKKLTPTPFNMALIQSFIDRTKERIGNGTSITLTSKAQNELGELNINNGITVDDIENAILNLTTDDYHRGIDPSSQSDFEVCAFRAVIGQASIEIYLKYGLQVDGIQILVFSNHLPDYPMSTPLKK